jgi:WD40 repeat protein
MTRRRVYSRPVLWLIFAAMVAVPSAQLARLLRSQWAPRVEPTPPSVAPTGATRPTPTDSVPAAPLDSSDDVPGPFRYEPVGRARAPIVSAAVSPTGRLVAVLDDSGEVTVWDVRARTRISRIASKQRLPKHRIPYRPPIAIEEPLGYGPQAAMVAVGGNDGLFRVWHALTGQRLLAARHSVNDASSAEMRRAPLVDAEISSEGGLVSVSSNGSLAFWRGREPADSALIWMTRSPHGRVRDVDISPDNRAMAVASDEALYLLNPRPDLRTWTVIDTSRGSPEQVRFSPGGGVLAAAWSDGEIRVYSVVTRDRLKTMRIGRVGGEHTLLAFSPDGELLAATDGNRVIQIWPMGYGAPAALTAPRGAVRSMWFTSDGRSIVVSARGDRYLRRLPLPAP